MAGDWIKMRVNLSADPTVRHIARTLSCDAYAVIGRLYAFWSWADEHTANGEIPWVTPADIDELVAHPGFSAALEQVGWLTVLDGAIRIPHFDRHNGESAKRRVLETEKKRRQREGQPDAPLSRSCPDSVPENQGQNGDNVPEKTGLEKRREEKSITPAVPKGTVKGPLQLRAEAIFRRKPETPLTAREARAFTTSRGAIEATTEADWLLLEAFYAAPQSETYARKDLATLIANWSGEIDRARLWHPKARPAQQTTLVSMS